MVALDAEHTKAKTAHARQVDVAAQSERDVNKARADLEGSKIHLCEVEQEAKLAVPNPGEARKQSAVSANLTEEAPR